MSTEVISASPLEGSNYLVDIAARIKTEHEAVSASLKKSASHAIAAGELLLEAKARPEIKHGQWSPWLREHCGLSERTAQRYMRVAKSREVIEAKYDTMSDLTINGALDAIEGNSKTVYHDMTEEEFSLLVPGKDEALIGYLGDIDNPDEIFSIVESKRHPGYYWVTQYDLSVDCPSEGYMKRPMAAQCIKNIIMMQMRHNAKFEAISWYHIATEHCDFVSPSALQYEAA